MKSTGGAYSGIIATGWCEALFGFELCDLKPFGGLKFCDDFLGRLEILVRTFWEVNKKRNPGFFFQSGKKTVFLLLVLDCYTFLGSGFSFQDFFFTANNLASSHFPSYSLIYWYLSPPLG